jgi:RNA polymerase sigma-70 factor (ECF subfamily)
LNAPAVTERTNEAWLRDLSAVGPAHDVAVAELREYLLRAILVYLARHRSDLAGLEFEELRQYAEDWAQSSIIQILEKLDTFRGASKFTTWAYRVAINLAAADLRRRNWDNTSLDQLTDDRALSERLAEDAGPPGPESRAMRRQIWETIQTVIDTDLTERQRTALTMAVVEDAPMEVIAEALGTNRNNVYKIVHDARRKLRRALDERGWSADDVFQAFGSANL